MSVQDSHLNGSDTTAQPRPSIEVKGLSYAFPDGSLGLQNIALSLPPGSRTLLIGGKNPTPILFLLSLPK